MPGGIAVVIGALLALLIVLAPAVASMAKPSHRQLGSNSVGVASPIIQFAAGQRICIGLLSVPRGTGEIQLWLGRESTEDVQVRGTLALAGGPTIAVLPTAIPTPGMTPLPLASTVRRGATGQLCVERTAAGPPLNLAGAGVVDRQDVTIDGKPFAGSEPTVVFYPPRAERARGYTLIGAGLRRMARLSPSGLPPLGLAVVVFLIVPWALVALLRNLVLAPRRSSRRIAATCVAASFVLCAAWAVVMPAFQGPDETEHYAYAQYLAETGRHPALGKNDPRPAFSTQEARALDALHQFQTIIDVNGRLPWDAATTQRWKSVGNLRGADGGGYSISATGHSVFYYALIAPGYWVGKAVGGFPGSLLGLRLMTALIASTIAGLAVWLALLLAPGRRRFAALAGLVAATVPMAAAIGGGVNNDSLVNALSAGGIVAAAGLLTGRPSRWWPIAAGALGVLMPLAKATGLGEAAALALCIIAAALFAGSWRERGRILVLAAVGFVGAAVFLGLLSVVFRDQPFTLFNVHPAETLAPNVPPGVPVPKRVKLDFVVQLVFPFIHFFGDQNPKPFPLLDPFTVELFSGFGWLRIFLPPPSQVYLKVLVFGSGGLAILAALRAVRGASWPERRAWIVVPLFPAATITLIGLAYAAPGGSPALQGRYLLPVLVALAAWIAAAPAVLPAGRFRAALAGAIAGGFAGAMVVGFLVASAGWFA